MSTMGTAPRHDAGVPATRRAGGVGATAQRAYRFATPLLLCLFLAGTSGCDPGPVDRLRARLALKEGNKSYLRGDYRPAMLCYERAIAHFPALAQAQLNWAYSAMALCRTSDNLETRRALADSAVASLQTYLGLIERDRAAEGPSADRIEGHILTLYLDTEQPDKARQFLEARWQRDPTSIATIQTLGQLAVDRGDLEAALRWNRERITLQPDSAMAHYALGVVAWQFSYYNKVAPEARAALLDEGLAAVLRAVTLDPGSSEALTYANLLYREKAKYAADAAERQAFEEQYKNYESRAQRLREGQNGALSPQAAGGDSLERASRDEVRTWPEQASTP